MTEIEAPSTVAVTINGVDVEANKGELLIAAAERHGVYIPHFCYHPRMEPVGMCRQCLVEVDTGRGMSLQPACMLTVSDAMIVDTESDTTKRVSRGHARTAPRQPPARLPGVRQGRRMSSAGSDHCLRSRRVTHGRREAPL